MCLCACTCTCFCLCACMWQLGCKFTWLQQRWYNTSGGKKRHHHHHRHHLSYFNMKMKSSNSLWQTPLPVRTCKHDECKEIIHECSGLHSFLYMAFTEPGWRVDGTMHTGVNDSFTGCIKPYRKHAYISLCIQHTAGNFCCCCRHILAMMFRDILLMYDFLF